MAETTARKTAAKAPAKTPEPADVWARLAEPFPEDQIERLPKALRRDDQEKGRCAADADGRYVSADGHYCGGWHARSVHLDYVGHAGITTRLNDVLGPGGWDFQPLAYTPDGLPLMSASQFWGRLTIRVDGDEVSKIDLAAQYNSPQEAWGDALRRCAMRFGIGTYLWSKSDAAKAKAQFTEEAAPAAQNQAQERPAQGQTTVDTPSHVAVLLAELEALAPATQDLVRARWTWPNIADLSPQQAAEVHALVDTIVAEQNAASAAPPVPGDDDPWAAQDPQQAR